ncbi:MAG: hypothetical protein Kow00121_25010 [Elainellaceae cyanobacterium]
MRANKLHQEEIGGACAVPPVLCASEETQLEDEESNADLYAHPIPSIPQRSHSLRSTTKRLKAKRMSEDRLIQISEALSRLADEIRYLNPLMAEAIDEAWDATEAAIEMLSNERLW